MNIRHSCIAIVLTLNLAICSAQEKNGARIPWTTYEAENMKTTGLVMGPAYGPYRVETESSGQRCVKLSARGQYVEFTSPVTANSVIVRYSLPDSRAGTGTHSTLAIFINGKFARSSDISSRYSWLYGKYPFTNDPSAGKPRHFYDELRVKDLKITKGDVIRIQRDDQKEDDADYCIIDLVDLENVALPLSEPPNSLSIADKIFRGDDTSTDYTEAFKKCIVAAQQGGKTVWIPAGTFTISGDIILPANITIQGAGMWYTQLVGDEDLYADAGRRVRLKGNGSNIHLSDFSIIGKLTYRSDKEANDGIVGSYGENSTISRVWVEHTKVGMWIENSRNLKITDCRMRNTMADGINFCVGMANSTIENCTARGTGDDCFAIWPTTFLKQVYDPGHNLIVHCTGQLPYLANGAAIYGGESNKIENCSFTDISQGSAILVSTTFPTESVEKGINNNFSGTTLIENCDIKNSGGFDHEWGWRAAVEICVDRRNIAGLQISDLNIVNSLSNAIAVIAKNEQDKVGLLSDATLNNITVSNFGLGVKGKHALFINGAAHGNISIKNSEISDIRNNSGDFTVER